MSGSTSCHEDDHAWGCKCHLSAREKVAEAMRLAYSRHRGSHQFTGVNAAMDVLADAAIAAHLEALKADGYVVVKLATEDEVSDRGLYSTASHGDAFGLPVAEESFENGTIRFRSVSETRSYAAALLTVAAKAEADE